MDVRCEKCGTEYELDDAKVTEAGVTVKCTSCGNLFKVRRRAGTNSPVVGPATSVGPIPTPPSGNVAPRTLATPPGGTARGFPAAGAVPGAAPPSRSRPMTMPPEGIPLAGWMVRNPNGQVQRFRELTTLQQWIVERKVTRDCEISRTGESWRKLGDIAELTSFFQVVDLADANARAAAEAQVPRRHTQPFQPPGTTPAKVPTMNVAVVPPSRPTTPVPAAGQLPARPPIGQPVTTLSGHESRPAPRAPSQALPPAMPAPTPTTSGPMMSTGRQQTIGEPAGPTGGLRGAPVLEPGWAGSTDAVRRTRAQLAEDAADDAPTTSHRPMTSPAFQAAPTQLPESFEPFDAGLDEELPQRSKLPWLIAALVIILVGGGASVYFMLAGKRRAAEQAAVPDAAPVAAAAIDASLVPTTTPLGPDAGVAAPPPATVASAWNLFYADGDAAYDAAEKAFEAARTADPSADAAALAGLAFTNAAWAQALADDADAAQAADARRAEQLRAESRRRLERADKFVKDALTRDPKSVDAQIASADVKRLSKGKPAEVDKLLAGAIGQPETNYVKGMARWSAGQNAEAKKLLDVAAADFKTKKGREHVRARYRLALIALADKKYDDARAQLALVFAASPEHVRGRALEARLATESGAAAAPAAPDAGTSAAATPPTGATGATRPPGGGEPPVTGDAYDGLVDKANTKAENGDCAAAMPLFERALDVRPGGVEALTGLGYCHLDRKEFARAQASFRAALGVSSRYGDAIIGLAEAYRFQGQNDQALEQYQRYLEAQPNGPKAEMARRQIKNLTPAAPAPTPAPQPAPETPAPAPAPTAPPDKPAEPPAAPAPTGQP